MSLTLHDIDRIANLARLELQPEEAAQALDLPVMALVLLARARASS